MSLLQFHGFDKFSNLPSREYHINKALLLFLRLVVYFSVRRKRRIKWTKDKGQRWLMQKYSCQDERSGNESVGREKRVRMEVWEGDIRDEWKCGKGGEDMNEVWEERETCSGRWDRGSGRGRVSVGSMMGWDGLGWTGHRMSGMLWSEVTGWEVWVGWAEN